MVVSVMTSWGCTIPEGLTDDNEAAEDVAGLIGPEEEQKYKAAKGTSRA